MSQRVKGLPAYPASGTAVANQLRAAQERYRKKREELDAALEWAETAFAEAFERSDATSAVRDRIGNLAAAARRNNGRQF